MRARRPAALLAVAFAFCGLTEDAVLCEEAAAHLEECCPSFRPRFLLEARVRGIVSPALEVQAMAGVRF